LLPSPFLQLQKGWLNNHRSPLQQDEGLDDVGNPERDRNYETFVQSGKAYGMVASRFCSVIIRYIEEVPA
jgi:hypothetical protein